MFFLWGMKTQSHVNLLSGKANFTTEPLAYRLVVIVLMSAFLLLIALLLKEWVLGFLVQHFFNGKAAEFSKQLKANFFKS